jgi:hypothetical protein
MACAGRASSRELHTSTAAAEMSQKTITVTTKTVSIRLAFTNARLRFPPATILETTLELVSCVRLRTLGRVA